MKRQLLGNPIIVALDDMSAEQATAVAAELKDLVRGFKLNDGLADPDMGSAGAVKLDVRLMVDLKTLDTPRTMFNTVLEAAKAHPIIMTVHLTNSHEALRRAVKAAEKAKTEMGVDLMLAGITVLTSINEDEAWELFAAEELIRRKFTEAALPERLPLQPLLLAAAETAKLLLDKAMKNAREEITESVVLERCRRAADCGLPAIVCSAQDLLSLKPKHPDLFGRFVNITPAVYPSFYPAPPDQKRPTTVVEAIVNGADILVVGSGITGAPAKCQMTMREATLKTLAEIRTVADWPEATMAS